MSKRFLFTLLTIFIIGLGTTLAVILAKGYRFSSKTGTLAGTGIISITSAPDQASVYLDGHLTTATNANINSLLPKEYDVKISKDGFIPWEKKVSVKEGLVTQIKATLFPSIPSVYPLTYNGVENLSLSPDGARLFFVVPQASESAQPATLEAKRSGFWVWEMSNASPLSFTNGPEPHQIATLLPNEDYSKAAIRWSPDSSQILVTFSDRSVLLSENRFNDPPQDITATLNATTKVWDDEEKLKQGALLNTITDPNVRQEASSSATLKWSPDETKFFFVQDKQSAPTVVDLLTGKSYSVPKTSSLSWLSDSRHLVMVESQSSDTKQSFPPSQVSISEFDGSNKSVIYIGNFDPSAVFAWPDSSRLVVVSSIPTPTASKPNLFGINLK